MNLVFLLYQWLIIAPILLIITIIVAISTIVLSPIFPNSIIAYHPARIWAKLCCYLLFIRVQINGLEKLNPKQSYVFVLNHQSIFDIFVVYGWFPVIFKWVMKAEIRNIPFVGKACQAAGHIFIDRSNPIAAKHSLQKAEQQLKNGISVVIFPEGTRTKTGEMAVFKRGAFRIATDLELPIVPVSIKGSFDRLKQNSFNINPGIIVVSVHEPVQVKPYLPERTAELIQDTWKIINAGL